MLKNCVSPLLYSFRYQNIITFILVNRKIVTVLSIFVNQVFFVRAGTKNTADSLESAVSTSLSISTQAQSNQMYFLFSYIQH